MASDLSNILKSELANTLEQLLSKKTKVDSVEKFKNDTNLTQLIECNVKLDMKGLSSRIHFYIPAVSATKFEYLMLGGMGELKETIDDETTDAINEIVSNICGSFSTLVNAQGLSDVGSIKSEIKSTIKVENSVLSAKDDAYEFTISLDDEKYRLMVVFDKLLLPYFSAITGIYQEEPKVQVTPSTPVSNNTGSSNSSVTPTSKNLELLYNVKLKLSVRLGTKIVLLKDILRWDVGEIIELEQMVNEPLEILINGVKIGEGEAVIVEGKFGLKIKRIINEDFQIDKIGL
ncbi:FliM/FliN family flagellar motor switch protein [Aliarcobacter butzleri]|uniref:FliM/FliN family flagellar motor switch protein n=1 Tax=Aliarcobacter butzleri TaxID=28197 RepID=UPI0021B16DF3|nr:FliM/FliN family flagellar motor switch protein [Aliarcobacter butzleri]MCT7565620.1 FliM/FliN family flagellar motor switch protein [Aliarcobacter butzleri]MCT7569886.1 FliM/FliN family flagellar motor switch protein [Aliarcobacter butzleri]MCT7604199.1 FliM/FliN family flagellar motor switch protein [Aliarcobacter butzleri]MCT7632408.1 FliM/FliN family flagellar motor switch protein [Aliarcobacter butzleri]MCT7639519.1 FliM/FliN family flagellar motor switch protein [Aliarcobacter butzler